MLQQERHRIAGLGHGEPAIQLAVDDAHVEPTVP